MIMVKNSKKKKERRFSFGFSVYIRALALHDTCLRTASQSIRIFITSPCYYYVLLYSWARWFNYINWIRKFLSLIIRACVQMMMSLYEIYNSKNITAPKNFPLHAVNFASVSCHPAPDSIYLKKLLFKNKNVFSYSFINQNEERNEKKKYPYIYL